MTVGLNMQHLYTHQYENTNENGGATLTSTESSVDHGKEVTVENGDPSAYSGDHTNHQQDNYGGEEQVRHEQYPMHEQHGVVEEHHHHPYHAHQASHRVNEYDTSSHHSHAQPQEEGNHHFHHQQQQQQQGNHHHQHHPFASFPSSHSMLRAGGSFHLSPSGNVGAFHPQAYSGHPHSHTQQQQHQQQPLGHLPSPASFGHFTSPSSHHLTTPKESEEYIADPLPFDYAGAKRHGIGVQDPSLNHDPHRFTPRKFQDLQEKENNQSGMNMNNGYTTAQHQMYTQHQPQDDERDSHDKNLDQETSHGNRSFMAHHPPHHGMSERPHMAPYLPPHHQTLTSLHQNQTHHHHSHHHNVDQFQQQQHGYQPPHHQALHSPAVALHHLSHGFSPLSTDITSSNKKETSCVEETANAGSVGVGVASSVSTSTTNTLEYHQPHAHPQAGFIPAASSQEVMIKVTTALKPKYWRNGRRNLQCFPACKVFGDYSLIRLEDLKQHDFMWGKCRGHVTAEVTLNSNLQFDDVIILARVHSLENIPVPFEEAVIRECMIGRPIESEEMENMKEQWIVGERVPDFSQTTRNVSTFEFKPKVWKYTEDMSQGKCKRRNVRYYVQFEAFVQVLSGDRQCFVCVGSGMSTSFEVGSSRVLARQKKKQAIAGTGVEVEVGGEEPSSSLDSLADVSKSVSVNNHAGHNEMSMASLYHSMMPHAPGSSSNNTAPPSEMHGHPHAHAHPQAHHPGMFAQNNGSNFFSSASTVLTPSHLHQPAHHHHPEQQQHSFHPMGHNHHPQFRGPINMMPMGVQGVVGEKRKMMNEDPGYEQHDRATKKMKPVVNVSAMGSNNPSINTTNTAIQM